MPTFRYAVIDDLGHKIKGYLETKDRASVIDSLRKSNLIIVSIRELKAGELKSFHKRGKVVLRDLVIFTRQLSALVKAGIPLVRGLNIVAEQAENQALRQILTNMVGKIESGSSLSDTMSGYPQVFSVLYINMIKAGEFSGALDAILDRLAQYLEGIDSLNRKVRAAFVYPAVVAIVAMLITALIFIKVIPSFKGIFDTLGAKLPLPTQIVISISAVFQKYFLVMAGLIVAAIFILSRLMRIPRVREFQDRLKLKLPLLGRIVRKVIIARFSRTLSTLLKSGVSILTALEIGSKTSGNKIIEEILDKTISAVSKGERIGETLAKNKVFPSLVVNLIAVGEETGDLPAMLDKIALFYEDEVANAISSLTSLIEPFIIVFLGVVIGGIVISMFLPILQISQVVGR